MAHHPFSLGMKHFFTERHLKLAGVKVEEPPSLYGPGNLAYTARCCDKATAKQCTCDWYRWDCPDHGESGSHHPTNTHD